VSEKFDNTVWIQRTASAQDDTAECNVGGSGEPRDGGIGADTIRLVEEIVGEL